MFQEALSRNTKHHVNVTVASKWMSSSTTGFIMKNRCFHFKGNLFGLDNDGFEMIFERVTKRSKAFTVRNQVKVTFTIDGFNVSQTVTFSEVGVVLRQVCNVSCLESHLYAATSIFDTEEVTEVILLKDFVVFFNNSIFTNVDLDLTFLGLEDGRSRL